MPESNWYARQLFPLKLCNFAVDVLSMTDSNLLLKDQDQGKAGILKEGVLQLIMAMQAEQSMQNSQERLAAAQVNIESLRKDVSRQDQQLQLQEIELKTALSEAEELASQLAAAEGKRK